MKRLYTILFILVVCAAGAVQMGPYDTGAARKDLSNVESTAAPTMTSITLTDRVDAANASFSGDIDVTGDVGAATLGVTGHSTLTTASFTGNVGIGSGALLQESWITPTLENSWEDFSAAYQSAGYYKDSAGRIHLRGCVKNGSGIPTTIFTLPAAYRPAKNIYTVTISSNTVSIVSVESAGTVTARSGFTSSFFIDNISFDGR
jgi:hypothetical protein